MNQELSPYQFQTIEAKLLAAVKETVQADTYPGYPTSRLHIAPEARLPDFLTDGPWSAGNASLPSQNEQHVLLEKGYTLDSFGRPLHPWLTEMITDPQCGVVTNKGFYRKWGPNYTADPIIITLEEQPKILLVLRGDNDIWALPGGFIDPGETGVQAAFREAEEEANISLPADAKFLDIYRGVVADSRTTAHAWPETTAIAAYIPGEVPVSPGPEVKDARWWPLNQLPGELHGSHAILIEEAYGNIPQPY